MYSLPSESKMCEPSPRAMNSGLPPTLRNARTGELTPPGISSCARRKRSSDFDRFMLPRLTGHEVAQPEAHPDVVKTAVQILHQPFFQAQIGLLSREHVLHKIGKSRAAAGELHHAGRHCAEQKAGQEYPFGEPRAELEAGRKIPAYPAELVRHPFRYAADCGEQA